MIRKLLTTEGPRPSANRGRQLGLSAVVAVIAAAASSCDQSLVIAVANAKPLDLVHRSEPISARPTPPAPACPDEMAKVGFACVDRYEAHLVLADTPEHVHPPHERPVPNERYLARSSGGVMPQAYISRDEAEAACRLAGKRLCTGQEWRKACGGTANTLHTYGPKEIRGRCNSDKPHLPSLLFGKDSTVVNGEANYNNPRLNQEPGYLAKTGEHAGCVNDFGVFDMEGNVHEWVSDRPSGTPLTAPRHRAVFMGGFFSSTSEHGPGCQHVSRRHSPVYHDYSTGFRCCRDQASAVQ